MTDDRPMTLRRLAARVATHQRIQAAVVGAIQAELPAIIEELLGDMAEASGGTLRLYRRKSPQAARRQRDDAIRKMLGEGKRPPEISQAVRCSVAHVYSVRHAWLSQGGTVAEPAGAESEQNSRATEADHHG